MSTTIEREIVQLLLDAKDFQKGVQGSIEEVGRLKASLDMNGAAKSMEELNKGSKVNFGPVISSLEQLNNKISIVGIAAAALVTRITNAVFDGAKKMANALVIEPIVTGLEEYETQLNAIQTILANTSKDGTTLEYVNEKLDELNEYADLTIYNFTQMTDSIGKFTAAGVDIDTSVASIKGIANVAALSGSNANQASTAMYQLSQAIASGTVRLQDWMSVENAGMGGQVFQEALMETGRLHGIEIDKMIEKNGSFRNSLQENWLTAEIMTETLMKFTGDLSQAQLEQMGYTAEQAEEIVKMAEMANDAATKIKTFTQLVDTMKEALQSGWGQTWRIILGDFEQAKELWGAVAELFGTLIDESSEARNKMLQTWADIGGRAALIEGVFNIFNAGLNILQAFKEAIGEIFEPFDYVDLMRFTLMFMRFSESILAASQNTGPFKSIVKGLAAAIDIVRMVVVALLTPLMRWIKGQGDAANSFVDLLVRVSDAIVAFREYAIKMNLFLLIVEAIQHEFRNFRKAIDEVVQSFLELEVVQNVVGWLQSLERSDFLRVWNGILSVARVIVDVFLLLGEAVQFLYNQLEKLGIFEKIAEWIGAIDLSAVKDYFIDIGENIRSMFDELQRSDLLKKLLDYISTFDGRRFTQFFDDARDHLGWLIDILALINPQMGMFANNTEQIGDGFSQMGEGMEDGIGKLLDGLIANARQIDYSQLFQIINTGLLAGLVLAIKNIASGDFISNALEGVFGEDAPLVEALADATDGLTGTLEAMQTKLKADAIKSIAIAIGILALSLVALTLVDSNKLTVASVAIAGMLTALFGSAGALGKINIANAIKASVAIVALAGALTLISLSTRLLAGMGPEELASIMAALTTGLTGLIVGVNALSVKNESGLVKTIGLLMGLSVALLIIAKAISTFGDMKPEVLQQGLAGVAAALTMLTGSLFILSKGGPGMVSAGLAIIEVSTALLGLAEAIRIFGNMDLEILSQGLQAVGITLGGFALFSRLMNPAGMISASIAMVIMSGALLLIAQAIKAFGGLEWEELQTGLIGLAISLGLLVLSANLMVGAIPGALATIVMSGAILILSAALAVLSTIPWEGLLVGLAGIAGVFVILGLAGLLLAPLVPILLGLGVAMLLIGAGAALFGVGLLAASAGLVALAGSSVAIAGAIGLIGAAIIELLPRLGAAIAEAFVNFLGIMAEKAPEIKESMKTIILSMIETVTELIPDMVAAILEMLVALLEEIERNLPQLIDAGINIVIALLEGIANKLPDVLQAGFNLIVELIQGITNALPDVVAAAVGLVITIADTIVENLGIITTKGAELGNALIQGIVNKINESYEAIKSALGGIIDAAIQFFKDKFGITSPSKVMYELTGYVMEGIVKGIIDRIKNVVKATDEFANKLLTGMVAAVQAVSVDVDAMEFNPLVRPVMDLSEIAVGTKKMDKVFAKPSISATLRNIDSGVDTAIIGSTVDQQRSNGPIVYNQYNYSSKALDRFAIYRQTKTHVARVSLRE